MPWFKVDDTFALHAKVMAAGNDAIGLWTRAGSWAMQQLTDGFVPDYVVQVLGTMEQADKLVTVGLWDLTEGGYFFHQWEERQPSREGVLAQRKADAERQALSRDPELRDAVRRRDGDFCRYCSRPVKFNDRRGSGGGTYDHVIPDGGTTLENLVVCCRGCNSRKGRRTPEQAGMQLRSVTRSDLDRGGKLTSSPDPTRPDPITTTSNDVVVAAKPRKRATRRPADWQPTAAHHAQAAEARIDLATEAARFADHHDAKGTTFVDWDAAFRNWLRRAADYAPRPNLRALPGAQPDDLFARARQRMGITEGPEPA